MSQLLLKIIQWAFGRLSICKQTAMVPVIGTFIPALDINC